MPETKVHRQQIPCSRTILWRMMRNLLIQTRYTFETMCIRDLRVFADALNGKVYHFRDKTGLECDAVVHLRNGSYGLIEVKLGGDKLIEE